MNFKTPKLILAAALLTVLPLSVSTAQDAARKATRQSSFEAFSKGDYEKALTEFTELLKEFTKDPLYKYFSGVCLVRLNREPSKAAILIEEALDGASPVKTISDDAWFYLGRARQMSGNYLAAIEAYNIFTDQAGRKSARELGVTQYIQQCKEGKGMTEEAPKPVAASQKTSLPEPEKKAEKEAAPVQEKPVAEIINEPKPEIKTTQRQKVSSEYERILSQALDYQVRADSLTALASKERQGLDNLQPAEKQRSVAAISSYEAQASSFQKLADAKYNEARLAMNPQQKPVVAPSAQPVQAETEKPVTAVSAANAASPALPAGSLSSFNPNAKPNPKETKVPIDPTVPAGLVYRIQMGVFRNPVPMTYFKGLYPAEGFRVPGTDKTAYYVGIFRINSDAKAALATVKARGFKDSFIVALSDGKSVSADRAAMLEKEWGDKPLFGPVISKTGTVSADTLPPEIRFRVEVVRPAKPLKDDAVETIRKVAGTRGLEIKNTDDGKTTYLVGKFITYESAAEYADLLVRNGYPEARVVAWMGEKEISIERARKLFDDSK